MIVEESFFFQAEDGIRDWRDWSSDVCSSDLEHVNDCWPELVGPADRSLVHWLRRLVFRSAWLDQRVKEGELDVTFDTDLHTFAYVQPDRDRSEEHTSELQSRQYLVCRLLLEKKKKLQTMHERPGY